MHGTSQYVSLGTATSLNAANFTLETWIKRTGAGVGTSTGAGGVTLAIPLITKGRAEAETEAADVNYFFGLDATTGKLVADFEEAQVDVVTKLGQRKPCLMLMLPEEESAIMRGMKDGEERGEPSPFSKAKHSSCNDFRPPMPEPQITPTRSLSTLPSSRPASAMASSAAITANCVNKSILRCSLRSK